MSDGLKRAMLAGRVALGGVGAGRAEPPAKAVESNTREGAMAPITDVPPPRRK